MYIFSQLRLFDSLKWSHEHLFRMEGVRENGAMIQAQSPPLPSTSSTAHEHLFLMLLPRLWNPTGYEMS